MTIFVDVIFLRGMGELNLLGKLEHTGKIERAGSLLFCQAFSRPQLVGSFVKP